jgi:hypothetical protein
MHSFQSIVRISAGALAILTEAFRVSPQSQKNMATTISNHTIFQFLIH